jgi:hypothetical protein
MSIFYTKHSTRTRSPAHFFLDSPVPLSITTGWLAITSRFAMPVKLQLSSRFDGLLEGLLAAFAVSAWGNTRSTFKSCSSPSNRCVDTFCSQWNKFHPNN